MLLYVKSSDHAHARSRDHLATPTQTHMEEGTVVCKRLGASFALIEILQEKKTKWLATSHHKMSIQWRITHTLRTNSV